MHPRGTTKAPACPHITRTGVADRAGRVQAMGGGGAEEKMGLESFQSQTLRRHNQPQQSCEA
ncbi:MAG: hypothetical protein K8R08_04845 [Methanosarcinales archaeon]|nr:hypothetical protein [Methanosarcinales archaeon]